MLVRKYLLLKGLYCDKYCDGFKKSIFFFLHFPIANVSKNVEKKGRNWNWYRWLDESII